MSFLAPFWLLLVLPWLGVLVYLLRRRPEAVAVPFLRFWPAGGVRASRRRRRLPTWPVLLLLAASLLAILAAGEPRLNVPAGEAVTLVVDRGITQLARMPAGQRYDLALDDAAAQLQAQLGDGPTRLVLVPGGATNHATRAGAIEAAKAAGPLPVDTRDALPQAVTSARAQGEAVVAVADWPEGAAETLLRINASVDYRNAGIAALAAGVAPGPQVMVRLGGEVGPGRVIVESDGRSAEQPVSGAGDVFIDLPSLGETVIARWVPADGNDALAADDVAYVARVATGAAPVAGVAASSEVRRAVEAWGAVNPPAGPAGRTVLLAAEPSADVVLPGGSGGVAASADAAVVATDALLDGVNVSGLAAVSDERPPGGPWRRLVSRDGVDLLAVSQRGDRRQVWFNARPATPQAAVDWLVLLGNVIESFGPGARWSAVETNWPRQITPGIAGGVDGGVAVNAPFVPRPEPAGKGGELSAVEARGVELGSYLLAAAVAGVLAAGVLAATAGRGAKPAAER